MREERRKTFYNVGEREKEIAVSRRQRSREKNALESEGREIEREPLHDAETYGRWNSRNGTTGDSFGEDYNSWVCSGSKE